MTYQDRGRFLDGDYEYSGQWFDDLGAAVLAAGQTPVLGFDIANTPGWTRDQLNGLVSQLSASNYDPYGGDQQ